MTTPEVILTLIAGLLGLISLCLLILIALVKVAHDADEMAREHQDRCEALENVYALKAREPKRMAR